MPGPEAIVERKCVRAAKERGWRVYKVRFLDQAGCPDRLFAHPDEGIRFIEFKAPGKLPEKHQLLVHEELRLAGFEVWVVDSFLDFARAMGWEDGIHG